MMALLPVLAVLSAAPLAEADALVLGVLEQPQCNKAVATAVRALFVKRAEGWVALSSQETWQGVPLARTAWTVALEGRSLGSVATIDPGFQSELAWTFPRDRLLQVQTLRGQAVPTVANEGDRFSGWCGVPSTRPLVVLSRPNTREPDGWKTFGPDNALRARLFEEFKSHAGPASVCPVAPDKRVPLAYSAKDLMFGRSYQDHAGRKIVLLSLDARRNNCDGPPDPAWSTHAFVLQEGEALQYLGRDLTLVDAGDYDENGASELLFWHSSDNEDGYTLVYDGLRKHVDYYWRYH
jgi:hypothetical protein